jgi:hypothetical protein
MGLQPGLGGQYGTEGGDTDRSSHEIELTGDALELPSEDPTLIA